MANKISLVKSIGNELSTTLSGGISNSDLSIPVTSGSGFLAAGGYIIIDEGITSKEEVVYVESVTSNTLTVATNGRGQGNTTAVAHDPGAIVTDILVTDHINGIATQFAVEHNDNGTHKTATVTTLLTMLVDTLYPVGALYITTSATSPAATLGVGTWAIFGAGKALVGVDNTDPDFNTAEKTSGAKTVTLDATMMPTHTHVQNAHSHEENAAVWMNQSGTKKVQFGSDYYLNDETTSRSAYNTDSTTATNQNTGGGLAHNNVQPSIAINVWKRTA